ncbi:MAG: hypothetical protein M0D55_11830 [Elusimicrobiota bacterium]|nr:MAG: hypothetical protein M0D55_11830 [Elusimicrobiota bacterium]
MDQAQTDTVDRLWKAARYLPQTVRLLGTRYRTLFLAHAQRCRPDGDAGTVADALAFADYLAKQERVGLLGPERTALARDAKALRRRFRLRRDGDKVSATEKWKILQWIGL